MGRGRPDARPLEPHAPGGAQKPRGLGRLAGLLVVAWLAVMLLAGWVLAASQSSSRKAVAARAESRTRYGASFVSIYARNLLGRNRAEARSWLSTPRVSVDALQRVASALGLSGAELLDAHGRVIVSLPAAGGGGLPTASELSLTQAGGEPAVGFAVGYQTSSGRRVFAGTYAVADTVLPTVLGHLLSASGWQADLVDAHGGRLAAGRRGRSHGAQASFSAVVNRTPWRIVLRVPKDKLYGFLNGAGRWLAWLALSGLTAAGLAIILLIARLARRRRQLTVLNVELARLAAVDPLTGLRNRRAIEEYLHDALSAARRHALSLSLLVIDVDHFKSFNDMLGHRAGDAVLAHTARVLDGALRAEDAIGRWGGEEFLVVLPRTDEEGALRVTDRLRAALLVDQPEAARAHGLPVTVTIGVAEWRQEAIDELVSRADDALYLGKRAGRDTVEVAPSAVPAGEPA